jgi:signal transduction histidine kinase/DNA-binding response OmpR family regulator
LRKDEGLEAAGRELRSPENLSLTDSINSVISEMFTEEDHLFKERFHAVDRSLTFNRMFIYSAVLLLFLGLLTEVLLAVIHRTRRRMAEMDLQDHEALLKAIMDGGGHAMYTIDEKFILTSFNRAAERITGYDASHFVGKHALELMEDVFDKKELQNRARQLSQKYGRPVSGTEIFILPLEGRDYYEQEWTVISKDGKRVPISITISVLRNNEGGIHGYLGIGQDITERKEVDKVKNEFISTVSHELRTPLTSIRGALGLIAGGAAGALPEKAAELAAIAYKNSERLVLIINDILDIEKIESGLLSIHAIPVNVAEKLRNSISANQGYGDKYKVSFVIKQVPQDALILADPDRFMQIMANLLSNAAKFSPPGSEVWVGAEFQEGSVCFSVRDSGPGIPEEFRSRIFQKFAQVDNSNTGHCEGTGLGLSIAKKLVEAMGGAIRYETEMGKGTTFFFNLPLAHAPVSSNIPAPRDVNDKRPLVLICEDDRDVARLLGIWLEKAGFATEMAHTLEETRIKLRGRPYSAMTLDLMMPDGSGLEFVHELRVNPVTYGLPVVVISVNAEEGQKTLNGDGIGVVDWLKKPIDEKQMVESLYRAISGMGKGKPHILHVEDDMDLVRIIEDSLQGRVYLTVANTIREAEKQLKIRHFDLVVLDLSLPDGSGLELLERLNSISGYTVPVLILSAHETDLEIQGKVKAALVKSRISETRIVETILSLVERHHILPDGA